MKSIVINESAGEMAKSGGMAIDKYRAATATRLCAPRTRHHYTKADILLALLRRRAVSLLLPFFAVTADAAAATIAFQTR